MKKPHFLSLFLYSLLFTGCVSKPANIMLQTFPHKKDLDSNKEKLQILFPEFTDENGTVIDGDGYIIIFPDKKIMVVDGYYPSSAKKYSDYIKNLGYSKIDYLVASHFHGDHIGSLPQLIDDFEIGCFYSCGAPTGSSLSEELMNKINQRTINHIVLKEGDKLTFNQVSIKVYSPNLTESDIYNIKYNPGKTAKLINNSSLVFKLIYDNFSMMFTGDVYKNREKIIVKKYGKELESNLLKVAHHGDFYTTNSHTWISTVKPDYGIIISPRYAKHWWGGYLIRNRYSLHNVLLLYNDKEGTIKVESDGIEYSISHE